jgi:hypothetical protein
VSGSKLAASSVGSTPKSCSAPSASIAAMPASVRASDGPWNTSTWIGGSCA